MYILSVTYAYSKKIIYDLVSTKIHDRYLMMDVYCLCCNVLKAESIVFRYHEIDGFGGLF